MKLNEKIILVMVVVLSLFFVSITALIATYIKPSGEYIRWEKKVVKDEIEQKKKIYKAKVLRGEIRDRNGEVLAYSEYVKDDKGKIIGQKRVYPYDNGLFSHSVGYYRGENIGEGKSAYLEKTYDKYLVMLSEEEQKEADRRDNKDYYDGASMDLTLDAGMTAKAQSLFENRNIAKGAIVVMNPTTGEIYCMYSHPTFNPNPDVFGENDADNRNNPNKPYTSRVTSKYTPGSVFKIVTALAAVENGEQYFEYEDTVVDYVGGVRIPNSYNTPKGWLGLKEAIQHSSNTYFANLSQEIGNENFLETAEKLYINKELKIDVTIADASVGKDMSAGELASTAYGQGTAMMTPLHMAMVASTVANDGVLKKPYFVDKVTLSNGEEVPLENRGEVVVTNGSLRYIVDGMVQCVNNGTGTAAQVRGLKIAGKTGTAETTNDDSVPNHTWFIGFAPADNPQVAICVMGEETGGYGGGKCGPIAAEMFKYCMENGFIDN